MRFGISIVSNLSRCPGRDPLGGRETREAWRTSVETRTHEYRQSGLPSTWPAPLYEGHGTGIVRSRHLPAERCRLPRRQRDRLLAELHSLTAREQILDLQSVSDELLPRIVAV